MTQLKKLATQLQWLTSHEGFRADPIGVTRRVLVWELRRVARRETRMLVGRSKIRARHFDGSGRLLFYFGEQADELLSFLPLYLKPGMMVADIGANIGVHTVLSAHLIGAEGRVFSFEADPRTACLLRANIADNSLDNVMVAEYAVADDEREASFHISCDSAKSSLRGNGEATIQVKTQLLDRLIPLGTRLDLLKIDVEGAELEVLRGAEVVLSTAPPPVIIIETIERTDAILGLLKAHEYRFYRFNQSQRRLVPLSGTTLNTFAVHQASIMGLAHLLD